MVDFSTPTNPFVAGFVSSDAEDGFWPVDLDVWGRTLLAADVRFGSSVPIVDVSNPAAPVTRTILDFQVLGNYYGRGVAVDSQYFYQTGDLFLPAPRQRERAY